MTPQQWRQVKQLFEEIVKLDPLQEQSFLENSCTDEEVRNEVKSLLFYHHKGKNFLPERNTNSVVSDTEIAVERSTGNPAGTNLNQSVKSNGEFQGTSRFILQK